MCDSPPDLCSLFWRCLGHDHIQTVQLFLKIVGRTWEWSHLVQQPSLDPFGRVLSECPHLKPLGSASFDRSDSAPGNTTYPGYTVDMAPPYTVIDKSLLHIPQISPGRHTKCHPGFLTTQMSSSLSNNSRCVKVFCVTITTSDLSFPCFLPPIVLFQT